MPALSLVLSILDDIQHHFMAISTLDAYLPAVEDLYYSHQRRSPSKMVSPRLTCDIRRELNDYEDEVKYTYISLSERDACKM
jgi:hypothetical protein